MIDWILLVIIIAAGIGALASAYQLLRVRFVLGWPLYQRTLRAIYSDHFFLCAIWTTALLAYAVSVWTWDPQHTVRQWIRLGLASSLLIIFWGTVIRMHYWYRSRNGDYSGPPRHRGGMEDQD